jgi:LmbE family N-acetylglucosaminyl deacetylase
MAVHGGPFDLTLEFGYRADPVEEPEVQARITMSWEHALAMVKAMQALVDAYQEQVGPLRDLTALREETG